MSPKATKAFAKGALGIAGLYELFRMFPDDPLLGFLGKLLDGTGPVAGMVTKKVEDAGAGPGRVADYCGMITDFVTRFLPVVGWGSTATTRSASWETRSGCCSTPPWVRSHRCSSSSVGRCDAASSVS
ncbi:MAG: hypothetical protein IPG50_18140 [Myxococcales bacterium]|nr:hypothetical protein [Myxococcales bacterium]